MDNPQRVPQLHLRRPYIKPITEKNIQIIIYTVNIQERKLGEVYFDFEKYMCENDIFFSVSDTGILIYSPGLT